MPDHDLQHYLQKWNRAQPRRIAQTPTSQVYLVEQAGEALILKLLTPLGVKDEAAGAGALRHFAGQGAAGWLLIRKV